MHDDLERKSEILMQYVRNVFKITLKFTLQTREEEKEKISRSKRSDSSVTVQLIKQFLVFLFLLMTLALTHLATTKIMCQWSSAKRERERWKQACFFFRSDNDDTLFFFSISPQIKIRLIKKRRKFYLIYYFYFYLALASLSVVAGLIWLSTLSHNNKISSLCWIFITAVYSFVANQFPSICAWLTWAAD